MGEPKIYKYNNIIYDEGDKTNYIFLIKEGEIQISKLVIIKDDNFVNKKNS